MGALAAPFHAGLLLVTLSFPYCCPNDERVIFKHLHIAEVTDLAASIYSRGQTTACFEPNCQYHSPFFLLSLEVLLFFGLFFEDILAAQVQH